MAKITRTFRIDEDLVKRFDKASEIAGVDKTSVVTEAIERFVNNIEKKEFFGTEHLVVVTDIYAPVIGKALVYNGAMNLYDDYKTVLETSLRNFRRERKDDEGTRYDIDNVFATIDFENKTCKIEYKKFWIGGLVESAEVEFKIDWKEERGSLGITEVAVFPKIERD